MHWSFADLRPRQEQASTLSHGGLKRLEIARALATEPDLLILMNPLPTRSTRDRVNGEIAEAVE